MQTTSEAARVSDHIAAAIHRAAARDVSKLTHVQQLIRSLLLDELQRYRDTARFPKNRDFAERTPYFVDAEGTRCAMAHLIELGGGGRLVERIATARNNAFVRELADEPELLAWVGAAGLSVEEAAAIQPSYGCSAQSECVCGGGSSTPEYPVPATGVLEVVIEAAGMGRVEQTYGDTPGIDAGATVAVNGSVVGARVLVPLGASSQPGPYGYPGVTLSSDGQYRCTNLALHDAPPLTSAQFSQAVTAQSCGQTLAAIDARWAEACPSARRGCGIAGGDASVGVLLALVSALVYRRLRAA